jgi:hypothetical protein
MSGGRFDYQENYIPRIIEILKEVNELDFIGYTKEETDIIKHDIEYVSKMLPECYILLHRLDYLLSGDDSFKSYRKRLNEDFEKLYESKQ